MSLDSIVRSPIAIGSAIGAIVWFALSSSGEQAAPDDVDANTADAAAKTTERADTTATTTRRRRPVLHTVANTFGDDEAFSEMEYLLDAERDYDPARDGGIAEEDEEEEESSDESEFSSDSDSSASESDSDSDEEKEQVKKPRRHRKSTLPEVVRARRQKTKKHSG